jgi:thioredoxin 1
MTPDREPTRAEVDKLPGPLLLEFGTAWCPYCLMLRPTVAALLHQYPEVEHVAIEDGPGQPLGRSFGVKLWPTFVLMRDGQVIQQLARPSPKALEKAMQSLLPEPPAIGGDSSAGG